MISCGDDTSPTSPTGPTAIDAPAVVAAPASAVSIPASAAPTIGWPRRPARPVGTGGAPIRPAPTVNKLIELPAVEVGGTIQLRSTCDTPVSWETSDAAVATVDDGLVTGIAPGRARVSETCGTVTSSVSIEVVAAPTVSYEFEPVPPAEIAHGDTGHFRVNVFRDGQRSRVTDGVTSSAPDVLRLDREGDRWRYTGIAAGSAEIRVTQGDSRRLTHTVTVLERPNSHCDADAKPAPLDFTLRDIDGRSIDLAELRGNVILLNFWATWCGPCKVAIPWFVEFQRRYEDDGLVVLGLSVDDTPEQIRRSAAELQVNYPMLVGLGREDFQEAYGPVWGLPVTFFIDREGTLCRTRMGIFGTREEFERDIAALL